MKVSSRGTTKRMGRRNRAPKAARILLTVLLVSAAAGCATGRPSSTSSWQSSSHRALDEAISGLGTARLVTVLEVRDRMPHSYAVVALTDAIESSGKEISSYQVGQPPDDLHRANKTVGDALDDASSLLVDVRVTLASPGLTTKSARQLIDRIDALRDQLGQLDRSVMTSPASVGSR
jgi:hypothetical protein